MSASLIFEEWWIRKNAKKTRYHDRLREFGQNKERVQQAIQDEKNDRNRKDVSSIFLEKSMKFVESINEDTETVKLKLEDVQQKVYPLCIFCGRS